MKEFKLESCNATLRYHDMPVTEVPIIFIHGIGCASSFDYPQVASIGGLSRHRRIIVDLLGSGFSDKPEQFDYSINSHARYLEEFVSYLGLDKFVIFGHSMGGAVSIALASRVKGLLQALILSEANLDSGGGFFSKKIASYSEIDYKNFGHDNIIQESISSLNTEWAACLALSSSIAIHRQALSLIKGQEPSWRNVLYSLNVAKTYVFGSESLPDPDFNELNNNGINVEVVSNAGHSMAWDNPEGLAAVIKKAIPTT